MVTSRDVAREAGVSQSTVSYVMSGKRPISAETLRRVDDAMARLGYRPNSRARALAGKRSHVIGLMIPLAPRIEVASLMQFIQAIASGARSRNYDILLVTEDEGASGLQRVVGEQICDGLILMQIETDDERIPVLRELDVPAVLLGIPEDAHDLTCIDADYRLGGETCMRFFAERGHRSVALIDWQPELHERKVNFAERFVAGVTDTAPQVGIGLQRLAGGLDRSVIARAVEDGLAAQPDRPAFLVPDTAVQEMVQEALLLAGRRPGADVSLVGAANEERASRQIVPLTTIDFVPAVVSERAVQLLFDALDQRLSRGETTHLIAPEMRERKSTLT